MPRRHRSRAGRRAQQGNLVRLAGNLDRHVYAPLGSTAIAAGLVINWQFPDARRAQGAR